MKRRIRTQGSEYDWEEHFLSQRVLPEQRLLAWVIRSAALDLTSKNWKEREDAKIWCFREVEKDPDCVLFSIEECCEGLGWSLELTRAGIMKSWKAGSLRPLLRKNSAIKKRSRY